jgi:hypothetical protein
MKNVKTVARKNRQVDLELLKESLKLSKRLAKAGLGPGRTYSLPDPYKTRLIKTSPAELLALRED